MSNEELVNELKEKKLPTFGTILERKDRLKKHYGKESIHILWFSTLGIYISSSNINEPIFKDNASSQ